MFRLRVLIRVPPRVGFSFELINNDLARRGSEGRLLGASSRRRSVLAAAAEKREKAAAKPSPGGGRALQRHPFSGLVDSAGELLHTP